MGYSIGLEQIHEKFLLVCVQRFLRFGFFKMILGIVNEQPSVIVPKRIVDSIDVNIRKTHFSNSVHGIREQPTTQKMSERFDKINENSGRLNPAVNRSSINSTVEAPRKHVSLNCQNSVSYKQIDDKPVRQNNFELCSAAAKPYKVQRDTTNKSVDQRIIVSNLTSIPQEIKSERSDSQTERNTKFGKISKNATKKGASLRKRSSLKYDPMKSTQEEQKVALDGSMSESVKSHYKGVSSRVDTNLRSPEPSATRDNSTHKISNSEIVHKLEVKESKIPWIGEKAVG